MNLAMARHHNGADLKTDGASEALGKIFPRQEIDAEYWKWRRSSRVFWGAGGKDHINVLECKGALKLHWSLRLGMSEEWGCTTHPPQPFLYEALWGQEGKHVQKYWEIK